MNEKETRVFKQTILRNLKRTYAKTIQHPELTEQAQKIKTEINTLEKELQ